MAEDRMLNDEILLGLIKANAGGGGGTTNYNQLENKPQIAGTELQGNKSLADLGIASAQSVSNITNGENINNFAGVETALDGVATALALKQNATDNSLDTDEKTIVGAINEHEGDISTLKSGLTNLDNEVNGDATVYPYADVITIEDAVPSNLADCSVKIEPVQDLHGYDKPWVGGAWKNKLPLISNREVSGVTITRNENGTVTFNGTASADRDIWFADSLGLEAGVSRFITTGLNTAINGFSMIIAPSYAAVTTSMTSDGAIGGAYFHIDKGTTFNNVVLSPMICLASETDKSFAPYENICPISGHTEASVQRDGRNLFDPINVETFDATGQGDIRYGHRYNTGTYTIVNNMASESIFVRQVKNDLSEYGQYSTINALNYATINVNDGYMLYVYYQSLTEEQRKNVCVNKGNDTTFAPYQSKTYTIALGDTIYGGTVDFDSGVMTVDRAYAEFDGSDDESWKVSYNNANILISDMKSGNAMDGISNIFATGTSSGTIRFGYNNNIVYIQTVDTLGISDVEGWKTFLSSNNMQIVYPLATPTTIQLTPQQIQLLKGVNTISASTGQISVTVNGVSGAIGQVQEQVNGLAEKIGENQIYSDTPVQIGTVGDKPLYRLFVTFETPISSVDNAYTSTGINSEDIELILRGDGINADGTYYGHLAFDPTFNEHQAIGVKGIANIKYAVIEYI